MRLFTRLFVLLLALPSPGLAATLPAGFTETQVASGARQPDRDAVRARRPSVRLRAGRTAASHQGWGAAADAVPDHSTVKLIGRARPARRRLRSGLRDAISFVYVYYTATTPAIHNRISRFTANGDVAVAGSETVILDLDNLSSATNHNGGALHSARTASSTRPSARTPTARMRRSLTNLLGKMLRINKDGTIPTDNPFFTHGHGQQPRDLGARPPQPVHVRVRPAGGRDVHQRRRAEHLGGDQRRRRRRQLRLADDRGRDHRSAVHDARAMPITTCGRRRARSPAARSTRR